MTKQNQNQQLQEQEKDTSKQATQSERFLVEVENQFTAETGAPMTFTDYEKALAQHLFLKVDSALKDYESKRRNQNQPAYTWKSVNMRKLALDAVHRVRLGLDALIANHIHPIPYLNSSTGKYDLDLQVGYVGKAYYRVKSAIEEPTDIIYELVYSNDEFKPIKKSFSNDIESYEFDITNPFDRGKIIGGFGYIQFENPQKNQLILVTEEDFQKSRNAAPTKKVWDAHPDEMRYKTLVHRVTEKLQIDPRKVNSESYAYVENQDVEESATREIEENANKEFLDIDDGIEDAEYREVNEDEKEEKKTQPKPQNGQAEMTEEQKQQAQFEKEKQASQAELGFDF